MMLLPDSGVAAFFEYEGVSLEGPLDLGQDKSPQCAAQSGFYFYLDFPPLPQCLSQALNVSAGINDLIQLLFPHIAQVDNVWLELGGLSPLRGRD